MTDAEKVLWQKLRKKQILGTQFYRQKPLANFIVDFFAPKPKIVIEVDGGQHFEAEHAYLDKQRDEYFENRGIEVLRYTNLQILQGLNDVIKDIYATVAARI